LFCHEKDKKIKIRKMVNSSAPSDEGVNIPIMPEFSCRPAAARWGWGGAGEVKEHGWLERKRRRKGGER